MNGIQTWVEYYRANEYVVSNLGPAESDQGADALLCEVLSVSNEELIVECIGCCWVQVASADLDASRTWFAHGDPWTVLLGVSGTDVVVGQPDMTLPGLMGPGRLIARHLSEPITLDPNARRPLPKMLIHVALEYRDSREEYRTKAINDPEGTRAMGIDVSELFRAPDLEALREAIEKTRKQTRRRLKICEDCQSPRYGTGCRCAGVAGGILFD